MNEELFRNKLMISSPTSISLGHITWFALDTKLVGRVKTLIKENDTLKEKIESLEEDVQYWKEKYEDLENQINNDYDPEIEIPQIHGEGISW